MVSGCHDPVILNAVQSIIQNMISSEDTSQQQLHYLQSCGFGGLWRFAGPFTKVIVYAWKLEPANKQEQYFMAYVSIKLVLKCSDSGILQLLLLDFSTFCTVWYSEKSTAFQKLGLFLSHAKLWETYFVGSLPSVMPQGTDWVDIFNLFSWAQNRSSFQNIVFFSEYQMMDKVQKFVVTMNVFVCDCYSWLRYLCNIKMHLHCCERAVLPTT